MKNRKAVWLALVAALLLLLVAYVVLRHTAYVALRQSTPYNPTDADIIFNVAQ